MIDLTKYELKPIYKDNVIDHYGLVPKAKPAKSGTIAPDYPAKMWGNSENSLQKCELEARIDEWNRLISITRINGERVINQATYSLALDRIAELSGRKESSDA